MFEGEIAHLLLSIWTSSAPTFPMPARGQVSPSPPVYSILRTVTRRKLLRVVDIAELLGVSKQRADQLCGEPDFPAPVDRWVRGDLWAAADVRRWARTYGGGAVRWGPRC